MAGGNQKRGHPTGLKFPHKRQHTGGVSSQAAKSSSAQRSNDKTDSHKIILFKGCKLFHGTKEPLSPPSGSFITVNKNPNETLEIDSHGSRTIYGHDGIQLESGGNYSILAEGTLFPPPGQQLQLPSGFGMVESITLPFGTVINVPRSAQCFSKIHIQQGWKLKENWASTEPFTLVESMSLVGDVLLGSAGLSIPEGQTLTLAADTRLASKTIVPQNSVITLGGATILASTLTRTKVKPPDVEVEMVEADIKPSPEAAFIKQEPVDEADGRSCSESEAFKQEQVDDTNTPGGAESSELTPAQRVEGNRAKKERRHAQKAAQEALLERFFPGDKLVAGETLPGGFEVQAPEQILPRLSVLPAGMMIPGSSLLVKSTVLPAGCVLPRGTRLPMGQVFPKGTLHVSSVSFPRDKSFAGALAAGMKDEYEKEDRGVERV